MWILISPNLLNCSIYIYSLCVAIESVPGLFVLILVTILIPVLFILIYWYSFHLFIWTFFSVWLSYFKSGCFKEKFHVFVIPFAAFELTIKFHSYTHCLLDSLVVECWLWVWKGPGSIPNEGLHHTKNVIKMVPVVPLFSTEHSKGKYWLFFKN